jgi:hypothetical protein
MLINNEIVIEDPLNEELKLFAIAYPSSSLE